MITKLKSFFRYSLNRIDFFSFSSKSWIYGQKSQLYNVEIVNIITTLKTQEPEFVILDVREPDEIRKADLPEANDNGFIIPKINIPLSDLLDRNSDNLIKIPKNKYIVCLCHHGIRSAKAAFHLKNRGYKAINIYGGISEISKIMKEIPNYENSL